MLGKKSGLTYNDVKRYEHFRARCTDSKSSTKKENKTKINKKHKKIVLAQCLEKNHNVFLKLFPIVNENKSISIDKKCIRKFKK